MQALDLKRAVSVSGFLVTAAVALLVDSMSRDASSLAWTCFAADAGFDVSLGIPLAVEGRSTFGSASRSPRVGERVTSTNGRRARSTSCDAVDARHELVWHREVRRMTGFQR